VRHITPIIAAASLALMTVPVAAQVSVRTVTPQPIAVEPIPPPATNLGSFHPEPGSLVTMGYDDITVAGTRIWGDVREVRDATGTRARGVQLVISEGDRRELPFVDGDELPGLLRGLDALLAVSENPTRFKSFEVRYTTRDNLAFVAYNTATGSIEYLIQAGSPARIAVDRMSTDQLLKIRTMFETALQKLNQVSGG